MAPKATFGAVLLFSLILMMMASSTLGLGKYSSLHLRTKDGINQSVPPDFELTYAQTLDHFNYGTNSYLTFPQRYAINFKYWGGATTRSPIFVYTGDEGTLLADLGIGFLVENAPHFNSLLVFIEHRYYGESNPFGSKEEAYKNSSTLQYFSSEQALADYALLITDLKKNLTAESSPVIAVGGSYGGMLAAWFRLKYPHIVIGALASSAPILYFDNITPQNAFYSVVTKDFIEDSESCYKTIKNSWNEIDKVAAQQNGLITLSQTFNTCRLLTSTKELKEVLEDQYIAIAQYDDPERKPLNTICNGINEEPNETNILRRIVSGLKAILNGTSTCFKVATEDENTKYYRYFGWYWQVCTELVIPLGCTGKDEMFEASPFNLTEFSQTCQKVFNVIPRPRWITTQYGGHNIQKVLEDFGSNIIFSNGLKDPYSSGGVLQNISNTIVALPTTKGSHVLDLLRSEITDPKWLISQRKVEVQIMESWIAEYNSH